MDSLMAAAQCAASRHGSGMVLAILEGLACAHALNVESTAHGIFLKWFSCKSSYIKRVQPTKAVQQATDVQEMAEETRQAKIEGETIPDGVMGKGFAPMLQTEQKESFKVKGEKRRDFHEARTRISEELGACTEEKKKLLQKLKTLSELRKAGMLQTSKKGLSRQSCTPTGDQDDYQQERNELRAEIQGWQNKIDELWSERRALVEARHAEKT
eukprot:TRINITY_DN40504_c0_g1_i1.p2 TRINITY_DN40504_c0_g1~~TRINITY_DN40504_c0_g1_i1.p2  ORF type:complete len:213 (+),score=61.56 TRINITY_DN40504_c0_g1_i1:77-715(+)